jgi:hypothetical protein
MEVRQSEMVYFMISLSTKAWSNLRSQIVTSSLGGSEYEPKAFTE